MATRPHEPSRVAQERPRSLLRLVPEMCASIAITAMWVAVFITAIWGPDATFNSNDGNSSTIPAAVFVTVFAFLGTWVVTKYGFRQQRKDSPNGSGLAVAHVAPQGRDFTSSLELGATSRDSMPEARSLPGRGCVDLLAGRARGQASGRRCRPWQTRAGQDGCWKRLGDHQTGPERRP
jgi:hypothetical protein